VKSVSGSPILALRSQNHKITKFCDLILLFVSCDFVICDSAESDHKIMGRRVQVVAGIIKKLKSAQNSRSCKKFGLLQQLQDLIGYGPIIWPN
jgi:hypothetical protein